jgi:serine/threonine protein kinase
LAQIVIGLYELKQQGITHNDIKISNIFITKENIVKIGFFFFFDMEYFLVLGDFGLFNSDPQTSNRIYSNNTYSFASDMYYAGICLYQLLTLNIAPSPIRPIERKYSLELKKLVKMMMVGV